MLWYYAWKDKHERDKFCATAMIEIATVAAAQNHPDVENIVNDALRYIDDLAESNKRRRLFRDPTKPLDESDVWD